MAKEHLQKYEEFKSFFTYENALTFALALTDEEQFDSNPEKWHAVIYEICQKYKSKVPELKWIYFTERPPMPPQSEQVDQLIKLLANSREVSLPNPDYPVIAMSKAKREIITKREQKRLAQYTKEMKGISQLLKTRLKVMGC
ncbi:hypothetical protein ACFLYQ_06785 [Chloroflexota bacterium]